MPEPSSSRLILGLWRVGTWGLDPGALADRVAACLDLGIDTFDLADIYQGHACEATLGAALRTAPALRTRLRLITKCGIQLVAPERPHHRVKHYDTRRAHLMSSVENALRHLGVECLHQLLIHRPDPLMEADEVAQTFEDLRRAGKVASFGVSNFAPHQVDLLQSRLPFPLAAHQLEVSLLNPAAMLDGTLDQAQRLHLEPQAWSPLGGGRLLDTPPGSPLGRAMTRLRGALNATPAQLALAWLLKHPARIRPLVGTGSLPRLREAVAAATLDLDRQDWFELLEAATGREVP